MTEFIQFALLGLGIGAVYALLALGVVVIYRGSGVLNFAQGAMAMFGAFIFVELHDEREWPLVASIVAAIVTMMAMGAFIHVAIMRPLRSASNLQQVIATLGILITLQSLAVVIWGTVPKFVRSSVPTDLLKFGDLTVGEDRIWLLGIAVVITGALWGLSRFTRLGLATAAAAENRRAAASLAWSPDLIAAVNWAIGGGLGALAGILVGPLTGLQAESTTMIIIPALAAALIGGFASFPLTLAGAVVIGVAQSLAGNYIEQSGVPQSLPFFILVLAMVLRGSSLPTRDIVIEKLPILGSGNVRLPWVIGLSALLAVGMFTTFSAEFNDAVTISMIFALLLLSVVVVTGFTGQLSLGQAAMAGLGALVTARLVRDDTPLELAAVIGLLSTVVIGLLFAIPSLRTRGVQLAVMTLGLGMAIDSIVFRNPDFTGALDGVPVGPQTLFGIDINATQHPARYALLSLLVLVLVSLAVANLRRGPAGRRMIAVRTNERAAASLGISVIGAKLYAFSVAAFIAGLAGILLGFKAETVTFGYFIPLQSILVVAYTVIGGVGFITGPLAGSLLAPGGLGTFVSDRLFANVENYVPLIGGVMLLLILVTQPNGMVHANVLGFHALRKKFGKDRSSEKEAKLAKRRANLAAAVRETLSQPREEVRQQVDAATLDVRGMTIRFGSVTAINDVSVRVEPGQIHGVIGPNGAGKTTLIDAITGFVRPTAGTATLNGKSLTRGSASARARMGIGRSFQSLELFEDVTVLENLQAASDSRGFWTYLTNIVTPLRTKLPAAALAAVEEFGLSDDLDKLPSELPYGRRRLVAVARAVALQPSILMLDEPAAGLDEDESAELAHLVRGLAKRWGMGILLIEHDMKFVMSLCDEITVLNFGKIIGTGTVEDIRANPEVRAAYLGDTHDEPEGASDVGDSPELTENGTEDVQMGRLS